MKVLPKEPQKLIDNDRFLGLDKHDVCSHCNGYGSSLKDPIGVDRCTVCGPLVDSGLSPQLGLVPKKGA